MGLVFFAVNLQIYLETIIIAKNWALASARYKKLCHWRSSELIVVKEQMMISDKKNLVR